MPSNRRSSRGGWTASRRAWTRLLLRPDAFSSHVYAETVGLLQGGSQAACHSAEGLSRSVSFRDTELACRPEKTAKAEETAKVCSVQYHS